MTYTSVCLPSDLVVPGGGEAVIEGGEDCLEEGELRVEAEEEQHEEEEDCPEPGQGHRGQGLRVGDEGKALPALGHLQGGDWRKTKGTKRQSI